MLANNFDKLQVAPNYMARVVTLTHKLSVTQLCSHLQHSFIAKCQLCTMLHRIIAIWINKPYGMMHHVVAVVRIAASAAAIISLWHQRHPIRVGGGDAQTARPTVWLRRSSKLKMGR